MGQLGKNFFRGGLGGGLARVILVVPLGYIGIADGVHHHGGKKHQHDADECEGNQQRIPCVTSSNGVSFGFHTGFSIPCATKNFGAQLIIVKSVEGVSSDKSDG